MTDGRMRCKNKWICKTVFAEELSFWTGVGGEGEWDGAHTCMCYWQWCAVNNSAGLGPILEGFNWVVLAVESRCPQWFWCPSKIENRGSYVLPMTVSLWGFWLSSGAPMFHGLPDLSENWQHRPTVGADVWVSLHNFPESESCSFSLRAPPLWKVLS